MIDSLHFIRPWWLLAAPFTWLVLAWLARYSRGTDSWTVACDSRLLDAMRTAQVRRSRSGPLLLGIGALLAALALAGPAFERETLPASRVSEARVVVLDLSRSMLVDDVRPNRFNLARFLVADILEASRDRQVGLVVYAGDAHLVSPLTQDVGTLLALLPSLDPGVMPVPGSRLDLGLRRARRALLGGGATGGDVVVVADDAGDDEALAAAGELRRSGFRVSVVGVGSAVGAPVPMPGGGFAVDIDGAIVTARVDATAMTALADAGGGRYQPLASSGNDLGALLDDGPALATPAWRELLPGLAPTSAADDQRTLDRWRDEGAWLLLALLPLAALAFRRGWLLTAVIAVSLLGTTLPAGVAVAQTDVAAAAGSPDNAPATDAPTTLERARTALQAGWSNLWRRPDQQAAAAIARGEHDKAARGRASADWRGAGHYRRGDFDEAATAYRTAADRRIDAAAAYNLGNALAREGRLDDAVAAYDEALSHRAEFEDAAFNRALVERLRQQQHEQQESQGDSPSDDAEQGQPQADQGGGDNGEQPKGDPGDSNDGDPSSDSSPDSASTEDSDGETGADDPVDDPGDSGEDPESADEMQADASENGEGESSEKQREARAAEQDSEGDARMEAWLRRIPDDPGGLLRRKFEQESQRLGSQGSAQTW